MHASSLYVAGSGRLHSWHPLTKLSVSLLALVAAMSLPGLGWLWIALGLLAGLSAWGRLAGPFLRQTLAIALPFAVSLVLIQGFFGGGQDTLFRLGPFGFSVQGALAGLTAAARIALALAGAVLLMLSTRPDALMLALTQRGLPHNLAYIMLSALQIFPTFQGQVDKILEAQQARGLETQVNRWRRVRLLLPLTAPLILGSLMAVEERAMALEARGFSRPGPKTSLLTLRDSRVQRAGRWVLGLSGLLLLGARIWTLLHA